jgi:hypothetical protein
MNKLLYNVTVSVDERIQAEWLDWMRYEHIPEVLATGCFEEYRMLKLIGADQENGVTFAIQYLAPDSKAYQTYQDQFAPDLQQKTRDRYGDSVVAFRTLLELLG